MAKVITEIKKTKNGKWQSYTYVDHSDNVADDKKNTNNKKSSSNRCKNCGKAIDDKYVLCRDCYLNRE